VISVIMRFSDLVGAPAPCDNVW